MKAKKRFSAGVPATPHVESVDDSLFITRADAKREAAKLREYRDNLEASKTPEEISARSSPIGRHDE